MKRFWLSSIILISILTMEPALAYHWQGFYAGVNAGAGFNNSNYDLNPTGCFLTGTCGGSPTFNALRADSGNFHGTDFTGGGQVGYNYLFNNSFLTGLEADFNYVGANQTDSVSRLLASPLVGFFNHSVNQDFNWFGTVRLRLGVPIACDWLIYATGGYAYGHISSSTNIAFVSDATVSDTYSGSSSETQSGWTAGAGVEYGFNCNWSARLEYLYVDLGSFSYRDNPSNAFAQALPGASYKTNITTRDNIVRLSINYRFTDC